MKAELTRKIQQTIDLAVRENVVPGIQVSLGVRDEHLGTFCAGWRDPRRHMRVHENTWFDLASVTKILSTAVLTAFLLQKQKIRSLDEKLSEIFPEWASALKDKTINDLLYHRSGCAPIFETLQDFPSREEKIRFFLSEVDRSFKNADPCYSDVGFMILGILIEKVSGRRLRDLWQDLFGTEFEIQFGPRKDDFDFYKGLVGRPTIAGISSYEDPTDWLRGVSQDPRAQWFEGDAGHAGLFGTSRGVDAWAVRIFRAYHGKDVWLSDKAIRGLLNFETKSPRWLGGFDRPTPPSQSGSLFPATTVGHLGFTGTSFWMDIETGFRVTLLTHRFAPDYDAEKLRTWRPTFHDWIWKEVFFKL